MTPALVSVYLCAEGAYIAPSDRTAVGVWIGNGSVEFVAGSDPVELGTAVDLGLRQSATDVPHPGRHEWSTQRRRSLDPILKLAAQRSWKTFMRTATLVTVAVDEAGTVRVTPHTRDHPRREDVSLAIADAELVLENPTPRTLGTAIINTSRAHTD